MRYANLYAVNRAFYTITEIAQHGDPKYDMSTEYGRVMANGYKVWKNAQLHSIHAIAKAMEASKG